jgi:starch synthase (maltosyl-transferring)
MQKPADGRKRVVIESVQPEIDAGRFPIKRIAGDTVEVEADVFADGHDHVTARLLYRLQGVSSWTAVPMQPLGNDRWRGEFPVANMGEYFYTVAGWIDHFDTWRSDLEKRIAAGQDIRVDLLIGAQLVEQAAARAEGEDAGTLRRWAALLRATGVIPAAQTAALDPDLAATMVRYLDPAMESRYDRELRVIVDREKARCSAWYEMFPRSTSLEPGRHGTFRDCEARLDYVARLGFDVLYLPPIHPIGLSFRKGKNNAPTAEPGDTGSPWAIGAKEGGHTAIHPQLGTLADFRSLVERAASKGIELALDIAFQCSPDHPWVSEHPDWFRKRPDGTIQYAENPPKKYQDIYPMDFESSDWRTLWDALLGVFRFWIDQRVRIFRVDNPHTKAFSFWEWLIAEIKRDFPDVLFLAEAFTRPRVMQRLAKLGFSQSYTYFTWRNTKQDLTDYFTELTQTQVHEYMRPNLWPNTPDILHETLQLGGRPAFLAASCSRPRWDPTTASTVPRTSWAKTSRCARAARNTSTQRSTRFATGTSTRPTASIPPSPRSTEPAARTPLCAPPMTCILHPTDNPWLIAYSKSSVDGGNIVLTVVNLDSFHTQSGWVYLDLDRLRLRPDESFQVLDHLTGMTYLWQGSRNYVELSPAKIPAHIFRILRRVRSETDFDYYL